MSILFNPLAIDESEWESTIDLLVQLIQAHPVYASQGLTRSQDLVIEYLKKNQWPSIFVDSFSATDLQHDPEYVNVKQFGSFYADYELIPKRNIIGIVESDHPGPTLIFNGHIDVDLVTASDLWQDKEGWKSGKRVGSMVFGRGSCDMLSGLAGLIAVANQLNKNRSYWKGRVILTVVTDEEIGGNGTLRSLHWLEKKGLLSEVSGCLIAEPTGRKVSLSSLGFLHFSIEAHKKPLHMGAAKKEENSIWVISHLVQEFELILLKAAQKINPAISLNELTSNFGIIQGGGDPAIPIPKIQLEGTIFHPKHLHPNELKNEISYELNTRFPEVLLKWGNFSFEGAKYSPFFLYNTLLETVPWVEDGGFRSPCDARLFLKYNIPTVIYGPGFLEQAHAVDEFICLNELRSYIDHLICSLCHGNKSC